MAGVARSDIRLIFTRQVCAMLYGFLRGIIHAFLRLTDGVFTGNRYFFTGRSPFLRNALPRSARARAGIAPEKGEVNLLVLDDLDVDGFQASVGLFDTERDNVALGQISKSTGLNVRKMDKNALGLAVAIRFVAAATPSQPVCHSRFVSRMLRRLSRLHIKQSDAGCLGKSTLRSVILNVLSLNRNP
jgi:hypothetical protein